MSGSLEGLGAPEYSPLEKAHYLAAMVDTMSIGYLRAQGVDLRREAAQLAVPVYFVQGAHEMRSLAVPFAEWYARLVAPRKVLVVVDGCGHRAMFEQPDRFIQAMARVFAETGSR